LFFDLLYNSTLLISAAALYDMLHAYQKARNRWGNFLMGIAFGAITVIGMRFSVEYSSGLIYDGRTVILSMAGLFGGWLPGVTAATLATLYRLYLGGIGTYAGVASIFSAVLLGMLYHNYLKGNTSRLKPHELLAFGFVVHMIVLLCQVFFLPWPLGLKVVRDIGLPYMIILPLATMITGLLLSKAELRRKLEAERDQTVRKLRDAMTPMVKVLVKVVESKDSYTANHQSRVAELASAIAEEMGLPMDRIEGLRLASMVHDIGKIQIPSEILNKPGKLSDIEFELIKTHVTAGYDILKNVDFPWPIARIVLEHHERIDGSGYPNGLTGDKLLVESKILAVADVVEAMSNHRPYRPAMGIDAALAEIEKNKGVLYDPEVVDACLRLFREKGYQILDLEPSQIENI